MKSGALDEEPLPFIIITQPENLHLFYCTIQGGKLARRRHYKKAVQPMSMAIYHSGCRDRHKCLQSDSIPGSHTPQSRMLPLDHCSLPTIAYFMVVLCDLYLQQLRMAI